MIPMYRIFLIAWLYGRMPRLAEWLEKRLIKSIRRKPCQANPLKN